MKLRRKASSVVGLPNIYHRLDSIEQRLRAIDLRGDQLDQLGEYLFLFETRIRTHQEALTDPILAEIDSIREELTGLSPTTEARITEVQHAIIEFVELRSTEIMEQTAAMIGEVRSHVFQVQDALLAHLDQRTSELFTQVKEIEIEIKRRISEQSVASRPASFPSSGPNQPARGETFDHALYQIFEDRYRGSTEVIRRRQEVYVNLIRTSLSIGTTLDVGCGRGEWLDILKASGFDAYGIDSNPVAVNRCLERGLSVYCTDAIDHLATLEDNALGAITLFQVLEHVPVSDLPHLLREILRVLRPGGSLVAEFPNIQSVEVGANTFWLDPTHLRPLHPLLVEFVAQEVGFVSTVLHYPFHDAVSLNEDKGVQAVRAADVALIAVK